MSVVECDVPHHSALGRDLIERADFRDAYRAREKIGPWPIFFLGSDELVAGRDNKHMDFRLSVMKMHDGIRPSIVVSTVCMIHNKFGQYYLYSIIFFTNLVCAG